MTRKYLGYVAIFSAIICIIVLTIFNLKYPYNLTTSDFASELILAKQLANENNIVSKSWYYTTEIRILNTQLINMPLFKIIDNWVVLRATSNFIMYVILGLSYYIFAKSQKIQKIYILLTLPLLFIPISIPMLEIVHFSASYIPPIILGFLYLYLLIKLSEMTTNQYKGIYYIYVVLIVLLSLILGMAGIRSLINIIIPAIGVGILFLIKNDKVSLKKAFLNLHMVQRA